MQKTVEAFKPRETLAGKQQDTVLIPAEGAQLSEIGTDYFWDPERPVDSIQVIKKKVSGGPWSYFVNLAFTLDSDGILTSFKTPWSDGHDMTVFASPNGFEQYGNEYPYYAVHYAADSADWTKARISAPFSMNKVIDEPGFRTTKQLAEFTRETRGGLMFRRLLQVTGLPEEVDLLKTLRLYLDGQVELGGEVVPLTRELLDRQIVIPAGQ